MRIGLAYDMRPRMHDPVEPETVGYYALAGNVEKLMQNGGIALTTKGFWDVARSAKSEVDEAQNGYALKTVASMLLDLVYHSQKPASFFEDLPKDEFASVGDVCMSSLGRYKHATTLAFGDIAALKVQSLHFNCRAQFIAQLSQFYITPVPNGIGYGFNHHLDDAVGQQVLDAVVSVMENAWRLESDMTLAQARDALLSAKAVASEAAQDAIAA